MRVTNVYFSKIIKIENRLREFNFRKLPNTNNNFHVDVTDDRGQRIMFTMYSDADHTWRISNNEVPGWIQYAQNLLGQLIDNETSTN